MIDRRLVLTGVATYTATGAVAQIEPAAHDSALPSDIESDYFRQVMAIGGLTLLVSRMAQERVKVPKLKKFAELEVAEQETLGEVLKALQNPGTVNAGWPSEAEIEDRLVPVGRQLLQKIRAGESDIDFAREFFLLQLTGHQQLLRAHEDYLKVGKNPASIRVAKLADQMTREHLHLLADIKSDVDSGRGSAPAGR